MRYKGQNYEIRVPIENEDSLNKDELLSAFKRTYERLYSFSTNDTVQIVNFGLSAIGDIVYPTINEDAYAGEDSTSAIVGKRVVYDANGNACDFALYDREKLHNGNIVFGPAIVEQMDSTTVIFANQKATVDKYLNMMIERK